MQVFGMWLAAGLLGWKAWRVERERRRRQAEAEVKLAALVARVEERKAA